MPNTPDLKVREAAEELSCHVRMVWKLLHEGQLDSYRVGAHRRVTRESLDAFKRMTRVEPDHAA